MSDLVQQLSICLLIYYMLTRLVNGYVYGFGNTLIFFLIFLMHCSNYLCLII